LIIFDIKKIKFDAKKNQIGLCMDFDVFLIWLKIIKTLLFAMEKKSCFQI